MASIQAQDTTQNSLSCSKGFGYP